LNLCLIAVVFCSLSGRSAWGQNFNNNNLNRSVGGVTISAEGVLRQPTAKDMLLDREQMLKFAEKIPAEWNAATELRMISLRGLEEALAQAAGKSIEELPQDIRYLAGIQRLKYVFVFPEAKDIVLAGPGEGWKVDDKGNVVGVTTGRAVLHLEDLMLALRTVDNARQGTGITCSIDPTPEGRKRLDQFLAKQGTMNAGVTEGVEKALGEQVITLTGVPTTSRFARTMVASDYRMKRMAMQLEKAPVAGLPSFIEMLVKSNARVDNMMPRWWLACDYEPLAKSEDGLAWELRGRGVKVMTEDELIGTDGSVKQTGKVNPIAQKWSDTMTAKYDELSVKDPVFGDLRNIMDMAVIAALISKEQMESKASLSLTHLVNAKEAVKENAYPTPKKVDTQCSAIKRGKEWVITASGGVDINSWEIASKNVVDAKVGDVQRQAATRPADRMIWDKK
jgi:hypothetical protein